MKHLAQSGVQCACLPSLQRALRQKRLLWHAVDPFGSLVPPINPFSGGKMLLNALNKLPRVTNDN